MGKDVTCLDETGKEYGENEVVYQFRKRLFLGRKKYGKEPKCCRIKEFKLIVEENSVEVVFAVKICSVWNHRAVEKYLSMLTGLKNSRFKIWIDDKMIENGIEFLVDCSSS
jgi:hypothetical protein